MERYRAVPGAMNLMKTMHVTGLLALFAVACTKQGDTTTPTQRDPAAPALATDSTVALTFDKTDP